MKGKLSHFFIVWTFMSEKVQFHKIHEMQRGKNFQTVQNGVKIESNKSKWKSHQFEDGNFPTNWFWKFHLIEIMQN